MCRPTACSVTLEIGQAAATPTSSGRGCRRQKKAVRMVSDQHREVIDRFTGPYAFLSNFHPCRVTFYGMTFPSVEAAFQAAKCADHLSLIHISPGTWSLVPVVYKAPGSRYRTVRLLSLPCLHRTGDIGADFCAILPP